MRINGSSQHSFAVNPSANIQRSNFVRTHNYKTTFDEGVLIPFYVDEVLPADTFNLKTTQFIRLATPITPYMDNLYVTTHYFFVPLRLLWTNFQKFMGEQDNPGDSTSYLVPQTTSFTAAQGSLYDYFGLPTKVSGLVVDQFHARAYNLIWNQWFRDENMQNSVVVDKGDGPDNPANYVLLKRGKRHDYFTSALPFVQKGPAVSIPLGTTAPIRGLGSTPGITLATPSGNRNLTGNGTTAVLFGANTAAGNIGFSSDIQPLVADLSLASSATINALRQAATLQQFYERDARGGTRYTEILLSHFNVHSPDARLQRPEYLGGMTAPLQVSAVPQTSALTGQPTPQGNLAAFGTATLHGKHNGFVKSFVEHGVIIGLVSVNADLTYQQGVHRMWTRQTKVDFYWPTFAHLGEQAVLNKEIYFQGTSVDDQAFGYQERYAEYRYKPSLVTGLFRSNATGTLDFWHLAQNFTSLPVLGNTFIQEAPPVSRIVAVPSQPHFIMDSEIQLNCARPMPIYSIPGLSRF